MPLRPTLSATLGADPNPAFALAVASARAPPGVPISSVSNGRPIETSGDTAHKLPRARAGWADSKGNVWVSEWNAGQLSRYMPASGAWRTWKRPGDQPKAYAVYVDDKDIVWVSDFGANAVLRFDPWSETFTSFKDSQPDAEVRQILGRPDEVWAPESGADRLMLIRTGAG
jgi:streptogramin lyase